MTKGKQQLKARLDMLLWAITHSNAVPAHVARSLRGKGYLYFPKSSWVRASILAFQFSLPCPFICGSIPQHRVSRCR
jgi:hypothetical protein